MSPALAGLLAGVSAVVAAVVSVAWVHYGYAWRNYRAARAAVPPARRVWLSRLLDLGKVLAVVAVLGGVLYLIATGRRS